MTTFQVPLKSIGAGGDTGYSGTESSGFVPATKVLSLGVGSSRQIVTLPSKSTITGLKACVTSAGAPDPVSAFIVNFGNSGQASRYGLIAVSALGQVRSPTVSAATDFDDATTSPFNTIVVAISGVSTTTFTAGGVRAFIEYVTVG